MTTNKIKHTTTFWPYWQHTFVEAKQNHKDFDGAFYAKVEAFNPGHSNKDRIAIHIIEQAEKKVF